MYKKAVPYRPEEMQLIAQQLLFKSHKKKNISHNLFSWRGTCLKLVWGRSDCREDTAYMMRRVGSPGRHEERVLAKNVIF